MYGFFFIDKLVDISIGFGKRTFFVQLGFDRIDKSVILLTSPTTTEVTMTEDEIRDIAIRIVDEMVLEELLPDCIDTNDFSELQAQDIIVEQLEKALREGK